MKRSFVTLVMLLMTGCVCITLTTGCGKTNKIASEAFDRANAQEQSIINDLYALSDQLITDKYTAKARVAAAAQDGDAAAGAVLGALDDHDKLTWLVRDQHLKTRMMYMIPQRYIWSKRGLVSIMVEDWKEAQKRLEVEKAVDKVTTSE